MHGQLGDGLTGDRHSFIKVISSGAKAVAAGFGHSMVLTQDDNVWATGWNLYGQCGDGSITSKSTYTRVAGLSDSVVRDDVTLAVASVKKSRFLPWAAIQGWDASMLTIY